MITPAQWQEHGETILVGNDRIFVRRSGQGPVLLLLHGFPTSSWDWAELWPALVDRHCVIAFDFLGFGRSDKPRDGDYRLAHQADIAEAVLAHFDVARYALIAHDYGDTVAQELLARQAEGHARAELRAAVLLNGGLFPETHRPLLLQRLLLGPFGPLVARLSSYSRFAESLRRICVRPWAEEDLREHWQLLVRAGGKRILHKLIRYMDERQRCRARWVGALQDTRLPVRVIDGLDDPISGAHMLARYYQLVPNADAIGLAGVGHYPQVEAPDDVLAAIGDFLQETPAGAA